MDFFGSDPGFVSRITSRPGFVNPVQSGPGFVNPVRSDPIRSDPDFVNALEILLIASCYGNRDKLRPDGSLGS